MNTKKRKYFARLLSALDIQRNTDRYIDQSQVDIWWDHFFVQIHEPRNKAFVFLRLSLHNTGWLFVPARKAVRYSMNGNGIELEQVVHTHRAGAVGREGLSL